jgi:hypothetical protein
MKALISPNEVREQGYRVAQVEQQEFEVALPLFWVDCDDTIVTDKYWFDPIDNSFKEIPITQDVQTIDQPVTEGTQTI